MSFINDIEINKLQQSKVLGKNLTPIETQIVFWLLRQLELSKCGYGHNLMEEKWHSNKTIAAHIGYGKETIRRHKESLHARGILIIDQCTWDKYQVAGRRRKTGHSQHICFSKEFREFLSNQSNWGLESPWKFQRCAGYEKKLSKLKSRQREYAIQWYLRYHGLQGPKQRGGSPLIGSLFRDDFSRSLNMLALKRSVESGEMDVRRKKSIKTFISEGNVNLETTMRHLVSMGYASPSTAKGVLLDILRTG